MVINFMSAPEILWCDHENDASSTALFSHDATSFLQFTIETCIFLFEFSLWPFVGEKG